MEAVPSAAAAIATAVPASAAAPPVRPPLTSTGGVSTMRAAVIFIAVVVAGAMVRFFHEILSPLVVATFLLLLIDALSHTLQRRFPGAPRWARGGVAAVLILAGFGAIVLLVVSDGPRFADQLTHLAPRLDAVISQVAVMVGQGPMTLEDIFAGIDPSKLIGGILGAARSGVSYAMLVVIYLGFLVASRATFTKKLGALFDNETHREQARRVFSSIRNAVEQYVRLQTLKALVIALSAYAVMLALGVKAAMFVAFLVFLAAYVPIIGAFAGAIFPALIALAQFGEVARPAMVLGGLGVAVFVIDNILMPKLQGDELNIDPLLVLISIGFWGLMFGPPGVLLSTPLTVTVMAVAAEFDGARWLAVLISRDGEPLKTTHPDG